MDTQNIIIIVILILLSILLFISSNKPTNDQFQDTNTDYNINPPTKTIEHPDYGIIKCITNDLLVCETILKGDVWEETLFNDYFKPYIRENTTVLDCGAYVGSHTILMKKLNRNNDIFVFENLTASVLAFRNLSQKNSKLGPQTLHPAFSCSYG
jgi:hypothetical protein